VSLTFLADEFASFAEFLEDALLFSPFHEGLLALSPELVYHVAGNLRTLLRITVLHMALLKRFRRAVSSTSAVSADLLDQVTWDVDILPLRPPRLFQTTRQILHLRLQFRGKKCTKTRNYHQTRLRRPGFAWIWSARMGKTTKATGGTSCAAPIDHGLANLLAAHEARPLV